MGFLMWLLVIVIYVILIVVTMTIAASKGRSALGFGLFAVFFPLIALIVALIIGPPNTAAPPAQK